MHPWPWSELPDGSFVVVDGSVAALVLGERLVPWSPSSDRYGAPRLRPRRGTAAALTPPSTLAVLRHGYRPHLHPSVTGSGAR